MTTPNRPPFPDWYQAERRVPPHVGPTQRELLARRIRSLRRLLVGVSFIGVATFTALASHHTGTSATAASNQAATTTLAQQNGTSQASNTSSPTSTSATLSAPTSSQSTSSQSTTSFRTTTASS